MNNEQAVQTLAALAQSARLSVFKVLVKKGKTGMAAGDIAAALDISPSALSFHLKELSHAGLVNSINQGRFVIYTASIGHMNALLAYLTENCCEGQGKCFDDISC